MISYDEAATKQAAEANNMHFLDAELVKHVLSKLDVVTVHDCFGVRLCELHLLMDEINDYYSQRIGEKTYSPFIII